MIWLQIEIWCVIWFVVKLKVGIKRSKKLYIVCAFYKEEVFLAAGAGAGAGAEEERYYRGQVANTSCEIWALYVYVCVLFKLLKYY